MEHVSPEDRELEEVAEGVYLANLAAGEQASMKFWRVEPGATLPLHSHHNEQIGFVIRGTLVATVEGEECLLKPGDSYVFPGGERHGAENRGDEIAIGIGILSPPRGAPRWGTKSEIRASELAPIEPDDCPEFEGYTSRYHTSQK